MVINTSDSNNSLNTKKGKYIMFIKMYKTYIKQYRQEPDKRSLYIQCL